MLDHPILVSANFRGQQMVDVFNSLNVKVSCLGNHDLDFGIERMKELVSMTSPCEWLISNLTIKETGRPIGDLARWTTK